MGGPRGKGKGELAEFAPATRKVTAGLSATGRQGFSAATSKRVAAKSTATDTYYTNADGSYTRKFSPTPVNYKDSAGAWQPIDSTLLRAVDGRWQPAANSLKLGFAPTADDARLVSVGLDPGHTMAYGLAGAAAVPGIAKGNVITYAGALTDTDVRLTSLASGMREDLILRSTEAGTSWLFPLDLDGLTATVAEDGSVSFRDAAKKVVGSFPASYAYDSKADAAGGNRTVTHATSYELTTVDGRPTLALTLDADWLRDPARVFPVTVDPSFTNTQAITTYVDSSGAADHSTEDVIKIGSYDSGPHSARSFLKFPWSGIDNSQISVSAASLDVFVNHANGCPTAQRFDVAAVTQDWTPATTNTYPGPTLGASIGNLTPATPTACANASGDPQVGDWVTVPLSVATFNGWANGTVKDYGLGIYASTTDSLHWKILGSAYSNPPNLFLTYTGNVLPQIIAQHPANGAGITTLTPQLSAEGTIDFNVEGPGPDGGPQYDYQIYDSAGTKVVDSGFVNGAYSVPLGKLQWGKTYVWEVQAFDGANLTPNPTWYQFTVQVPQPAITSTLAQNSGGKGFDPSIGNYTTSATDADISTVGPALSVVRDYNSRDPRTKGAFGAAWSSLYDMRAAEKYLPDATVSNVVITYPEGSQVGYGRNADGTFTPPGGRAAKLIKLANGYELVDKSDTTYRFTQSLGSGVYGISSITDANNRAETFTWSGSTITTVTAGVSGRALHVNWTTPTGASGPHVSTVVTDPVIAAQPTTALTWTYNYTGDRLTSVCPPGTTTACTQYGYVTGSPYYSNALDQGPSSYWPLAETSGTTAASAVFSNAGQDNGVYSNVTLGNTAGPLTGGTAMAPSFNGTSSMVSMPDLHMGQALAFSVSIWFKTTATAGVLLSSSDMSIAPTADHGNYSPTLYVGSDGKLLGQFWITDPGLPTPIKSTAVVNNGAWHHVVLTGSQTSQVMYLDGAQVGTLPGWGALGNLGASMPWLLSHDYLGTGFLGGLPWPDNPYTNDPSTLHAVYFNGSISNVSYYGTQIGLPEVTSLRSAATTSTSLLSSITRPSGNAYAAVTYHPVSSAVTHLTDENGGGWTLAAPTVAGSSKVYRGSVLGAGPLAYYRLGEAAGASQAISEVRYGAGTYTNTTLGTPGRFSDQPAATFNGTTSSVRVPASALGTGSQSYGMWFKTSTTGGVLLSTQASAIGSTTCPCLPILWITGDGKLRGLAPSTTPSGPLTSPFAGKCVDDWGSGTNDGNIIVLYTCNGTAAQNWTVNADGTVRVFGKCMSVAANGVADFTKIQLATCTGATGQIWQPFNSGLRNPTSGKCLDDPASTLVDGTQLQIYTCNNTDAQHWTVALTSAQPVNDGKWHQAVLATSGTTQTLYVDGVRMQASTNSTSLTRNPQAFTYLGAGYAGTGWSNLPASTTAYFNGGMGEAAFYASELTGAQVTAQFDAAHNSFGLSPVTTVQVTDPGNKTLKYEYDPMRGNRLIASTDGRGYRTSYGYDTSGFLYTTTDPNGAVATSGHDAEGNEVSKTSCQNQTTGLCSTAYMTYKANTMGVDQAKGATVTASSSYTASGGWNPVNVVDGITTSITSAPGWSSLGSATAATTQWVQADMGSARSLNRVDLYPRSDAVGAGFPQAFTVAVSADGTTWNTITTQTNYPKPTTPAPVSFGFTAQSVRYVKVNATTLRTDGSATFFLQFAEITALNDLPDPTAGVIQTQRDPRSTSASDNRYLTTYFYDAMGNNYATTGPPVPGFPGGRTSFISYTDGTTVSAVDTGFVPSGLPYRTISPGNAVTTVAYFHNGDVATTTDADGLVTRFAYDNLGRVASKTVQPGKPAGWWRLNQTSGTVVTDSSGLANAGAATGVTWANGVANFSEASGSRVLVSQPVINTGSSYTLSAWVNLSTTATSYVSPLISIWGNYYPAAEISYNGGGGWKFQTSDRDVSSPTVSIAQTSTPATAGVWTYVVGVYDAASGVMTLYVNGAAVATATTSNTWSARWFYIGNHVNGAMSNAQVYQRALSATDITSLYAAGNLGSVTSDTTPSGLVTSYGYDGEDRVTSEVDPPVTDRVTGAVHTPHITSVYDWDGHLKSQTVADDTGGDAARTKSSTYNQYDQVQTALDAKSKVTSFTYDAYGNKTTETDPLGTITTYTYDANGHLLTQALTNYTGDPVNPQAAVSVTEVSRSYDPAGRLASITNALGNKTSYTYTDNGLPVNATRRDSAGNNPFVLKADTYDGAGNIAQETTNNGATVTAYTYDGASRTVKTQEDPAGLNRTTALSYTADDQLATSTHTDSTGATLTTAATYDPMGRVTSKSVAADGTGHPVGWWRLNQSGSAVIVDSSGTGNTAQLNSGVKWTGGAALFNGTTGAIATAGPVLTTTTSYSVSAWVNLTAAPTGYQAVVSQDANVNGGFYLHYNATDAAWAFGQPISDTTNSDEIRAHATTPPVAATWYHLVGTFNSTSGAMTLYVNGSVAGTATNPAPVAASGPLTIGRTKYNGAPTNFLNGQVSNVQVYQRVLSAAEVTALNTAGRTGGTTASSRQVTTSWQLDQRGLPLSMKDANGNVTNYAYDEAGQLAVTTSPAVMTESGGSTPVSSRPVTTHGYDTFGDEVETQNPRGGTVVNVYDANGRPVSTRLPSYTPPGSSTAIVPLTVRTYNDIGQLTKVSDPLIHDTSYLYDQMGNLAKLTDPNNGVTHYTFDLNGEQLTATDPTGAQLQATYDHMGRQLTATAVERFPASAAYTTTYSYASSTANPGGAWLASETTAAGVVTSYAYDKLGEQTSLTDGASNITAYQYDYLGRRKLTTLPDNSKTTVAYDELSNAVAMSTVDPAGTTLTSQSATYDPVGNLLSSTDARNTVTRFTYDALGRMTQEIQPDTATTAITTTFGFDATDNQTRFTDGRNSSWVYAFNPWNLPESEIEPATATYTSAADRTFTTAYDATGHALTRTLPGGVSVAATYDPMGHVLTQTGTGAAAASAARSFGYDLAGRVTSAASAAAGTAPATSVTLTYNDRGLPLTVNGSAGNSSFGYNADGKMGSRVDPAGTTTYVYDTAGRLGSIADPATASTMSFTYNTMSQPTTINHGSDQRTLGYDTMHRLQSDTLKTAAAATVASITYGYDKNSNLTSKVTTGFTGASSNTYGYDLANRMTSWTSGTTTVNYAYDASSNRTQVGANVYTYDSRDQLTSDGANTYQYTARGTLSSQAGPGGNSTSTSDAYGQTITHDTQKYAYDAIGRLITVTPGTGAATQLRYSGTGNTTVADGTNTYSYNPAGVLIGTGAAAGGSGVLTFTDQHRDVVGAYATNGAALAGSTAYDPLGKVLSTLTPAGRLGYQSGWTDPATQRVNMGARWYSPQTGQFTSRDTVEQAASPASASFNPFAYAGDNPMTNVDTDGHGFWSTVTSWGKTAVHATVSAWHATTNFVSTYIYHPIATAVTSAWNWTVHTYQSTVNRIKDELDRLQQQLAQLRAQIDAQIRAFNNEVKQRAAQAAHAVSTAYHATANATVKAVTTAGTFVKHHAAAIGSFVISTAVFMGCEAVLGALTAGVGAVAGAVACGALAGAAGGLFEQGLKCAGGEKGACSAGSFVKAGLVGGAIGAFAGLGGALGGKVLSAVGGRAMRAIGGLFGRGGAEAGAGAAEGVAASAARSSVDTAAESAAGGAARSGTREAAEAGAPRGGEIPRGRGPSGERPTEQPRAGEEPSGGSCNAPVHSFSAATPVLMADGSTKPIEKVEAGDKIRNSAPTEKAARTHTVHAVILTKTDHDFVDVTIASGAAARTSTLTTTFHHPFYERTQASFVNAMNLRAGDELQTADGATAKVTAVRLYHATQDTYDLSIDGLHTYYVLAGTTSVLVHNCPTGDYADKLRARGIDPNTLPHAVAEEAPAAAEHLVLGVSGGIREFAASIGGKIWKDPPFWSKFWAKGTSVAEENVGKMIDYVVEGGGRITFRLAGIEDIQGILAGTSRWLSKVTSSELRYVCKNPAARAITTFVHEVEGTPDPC